MCWSLKLDDDLVLLEVNVKKSDIEAGGRIVDRFNKE